MRRTILTRESQPGLGSASVKGDHNLDICSEEKMVKAVSAKYTYSRKQRLTKTSADASYSQGHRAEPFDRGTIRYVQHPGSFPEPQAKTHI